MSLGSWFRDYVYIPLGGNRVKKSRWVLNLLVVWVLTGIWHGANYTFICWGIFYFVLLLVERLTGFTEKIGMFSHVYALVAIIIGWTMFRAPDINSGLIYIGKMFGIGVSSIADNVFWYYIESGYSVLLIGIIFSLPIINLLRKNSYWKMLEPIICGILFIISMTKIISNSYNPFIYFNF